MLIDTTHRTDAPEIMDDFTMQGQELRDTLDQIARINRILGGNRITLDGVKKLLARFPKDYEITIADLGCGNGDMLRMLSDFGLRQDWHFKLIGVDANADTVRYARELSAVYPNISYVPIDIFSADFDALQYDIALCTLTLHHFSEDELLHLLTKLKRKVTVGIVVNDLHRSSLAYRLFQLAGWVFRLKKMPRNDGLISILRGFKRAELEVFSQQLHLNSTIRWKWAFRYQWIISKI